MRCVNVGWIAEDSTIRVTPHPVCRIDKRSAGVRFVRHEGGRDVEEAVDADERRCNAPQVPQVSDAHFGGTAREDGRFVRRVANQCTNFRPPASQFRQYQPGQASGRARHQDQWLVCGHGFLRERWNGRLVSRSGCQTQTVDPSQNR
jgi:hypothetical protein